MSVWRGIDKNAFESDLSRLCRRQKLQDPKGLTELRGRDNDHSILSYTTERELADSFAFIAATTNQPAGITASAIHQQLGEGCISLTIAANEGIREPVVTVLQATIDCLKQQAARSISAPAAERRCRGLILDIHRDRILGRLGSAKARSQKPVDIDIRTRAQSLCTLLKQRRDRSDARESLQTFIAAINDAERSEPASTPEKDALRCILDAAYNLMHGNCRLFDKLPGRTSSKEYRALRALANYWRICQFLVKCTANYRVAFLQLDLEVLESPPVFHSNYKRRYIHAEVQIVLHLEQKLGLRPRYISSSKKPCFLCYCFIRAHGTYGTCQSHGEVYEMWTVPNEAPLSTAAMANINRALKITTQDVQRALSSKLPQKGMYLHPIQTVSKVLLDRLSSAPASIPTTPGSASAEDVAATMAKLSIATETPRLSVSPESTSEVSPQGEHDIDDPSRSGSWADYARAGQVELFLDADRLESRSSTVSCSMKLCTTSEAERSIERAFQVNVGEMGRCEEVTTAFPDHTAAFLLLVYGDSQNVVQLRWH